MAHVVVYLQRTPHGLHPASAVALSVARDVASTRGASVTACALGDAGAFDEALAHEAGCRGADTLVFGGPNALMNLSARLRPVHVLGPWTHEGSLALQGLPGGPATPRIVGSPRPAWRDADAVTGIVAATPAWHRLDATLEPEYERDVGEVALPDWVKSTAAATATTERFELGPQPYYVLASASLDPATQRAVQALDPKFITAEAITAVKSGTILWLVAGEVDSDVLSRLQQRSAYTRLVLLCGTEPPPAHLMTTPDWILEGSFATVLQDLQRAPWIPSDG